MPRFFSEQYQCPWIKVLNLQQDRKDRQILDVPDSHVSLRLWCCQPLMSGARKLLKAKSLLSIFDSLTTVERKMDVKYPCMETESAPSDHPPISAMIYPAPPAFSTHTFWGYQGLTSITEALPCQMARRREPQAVDKLNVIPFISATARFLCDWQRLIGENASQVTGWLKANRRTYITDHMKA